MKKLLKILPVVMVVCLVATSVFAVSVPTTMPNGTASSTVENLTGNIWNTVVTVVQVLAVGCVVFAGLRYMFASADQKADIKKSMGILAIGAILVFGATFVLQIIANVTNQVANGI